jgi:uncharacterized integral membrane protein
MNAKIVTLVILIALMVVIMLQNTQNAVLTVLFWSFFIPRILLIFIVLLVGFTAGYVAASIRARKAGSSE